MQQCAWCRCFCETCCRPLQLVPHDTRLAHMWGFLRPLHPDTHCVLLRFWRQPSSPQLGTPPTHTLMYRCCVAACGAPLPPGGHPTHPPALPEQGGRHLRPHPQQAAPGDAVHAFQHHQHPGALLCGRQHLPWAGEARDWELASIQVYRPQLVAKLRLVKVSGSGLGRGMCRCIACAHRHIHLEQFSAAHPTLLLTALDCLLACVSCVCCCCCRCCRA